MNSLPDTTPEGEPDAVYQALAEAECWVLDTPASTPGEAKVKLRLVASLWHEGSVLDRERATEIMAEIAAVLA